MGKKYFEDKKAGFTLVEVMLAVGVIAVSVTSMIGLLAAITNNLNQIRYQNKAVSLISNLETTLRTKKFDTVFRWVSNPSEPHVIYFWDEYQTPEDPDNLAILTKSTENDGYTSGVMPSQETLDKVEGNVYRALLTVYQNGLKGQKIRLNDPTEYAGGSIGEDPNEYAVAYLPIKVEILVDPKDDVISGSGDEVTNETRRVYEDIIVKMR